MPPSRSSGCGVPAVDTPMLSPQISSSRTPPTSLLFILRVLCAYFRRCPVEQICRRFAITPSMVYLWKALFLAHKEIWLGGFKVRGDCPGAFSALAYAYAGLCRPLCGQFLFKNSVRFSPAPRGRGAFSSCRFLSGGVFRGPHGIGISFRPAAC